MAGNPMRSDRREQGDRLRRLVAASARGDALARQELARECLDRVRRTILFTCGPDPGHDDLVQMAMARVFERLDRFEGGPGFLVWVDRVTLNLARDHFRRESRVRLVQLVEGGVADTAAAQDRPDRLLERREQMERLAEHVAALKPKYRVPVTLSLLYGYSVPEISAVMELSYEAAKKRLYRGRAQLMQRLLRDTRDWTPPKGGPV